MNRGARERSVGRTRTEEHPADFPDRAPTAQVTGQCLAHLHRQRQSLLTPTLSTDDQITGTPVDVVEIQSGHLTSAQPQASQQDQDGVVAATDRTSVVAALQ